MAELKQLAKIASEICKEPAKHVNLLNQLIPGLLTLIDMKLNSADREQVLSLIISVVESFSK